MQPLTSSARVSPSAAKALPRAAWDEGLQDLEQLLQHGAEQDTIVRSSLELLVAASGAAQARWIEIKATGEAKQLVWPLAEIENDSPALAIPANIGEPTWRLSEPSSAHVSWRIENGTAAQLTLVELPTQVSPTRIVEQELCAFALAVAELLADGARRVALRDAQHKNELWPRLLAAEQRWQSSETLAATAQAAVESLRQALPADRVALLLADQRAKPRWKLHAVSGAALLDRRGDHAALLAELVRHAALLEKPLILGRAVPLSITGRVAVHGEAEPALSEPAAPDSALQVLWQEYADLTAVQGMLILSWQARWQAAASVAADKTTPPHANQEQQLALHFAGETPPGETEETAGRAWRGAWVSEWYATDSASKAAVLPALERAWLVQRAALAVERSRRIENLPAIKLVRRWGRYRETWSARGVTLARLLAVAAVVLVALLVWLPVPFQITARARLWPVERREIFAPEDATVARVMVKHGETIKLDQPLLQLTSPALEQQRAQLQGELATAQQRQATIRAERLRLRGDVEADLTRAQQLTAEEAELAKVLASTQAQLAILDERRAALVLRSPIAGQVLTWNVLEQLAGQPVRRGQLLLSLADPNQAWLAEGRIGEESVGYVRAALKESNGVLPAQVRTITDPSTPLAGRLRELSVRSETDPVWGTGVRALVRLDDTANQAAFSPGTEATIRIPCGERAWGFVLFRDVIDGVRRWW